MTDKTTHPPHHFAVGIGAGPANLSLAALFKSTAQTNPDLGDLVLFDRQPSCGWHENLLHNGVRMQTSWLKDLAAVVDPTNELTFLNYIVTTGRLFALLNSQFDVIPRREYMRYLEWAANRLGNVRYDVTVDRVAYGANGFEVHSGDRLLATADHVVLGVGTQSATIPGLATLPSDRSFLSDQLAARIPAMKAYRSAPVAVIGGGQTGIECVLKLLGEGFTDIRWYTRPTWFRTIDDSPVANDFYRPSHQEFLQGLSRSTRRRLVEEMLPTGVALTPGALRVLYQANYDGMLERGDFPVTLLPGREVSYGELRGDDVVLDVASAEARAEHRVRYAVIAVGRVNAPLPLDPELRERVDADTDGEPLIAADYSVIWKGMNGHKMFALNRSMYANGVPDANLTLLPVRAAIVINSMLGRDVYRIRDDFSPVKWG